MRTNGTLNRNPLAVGRTAQNRSRAREGTTILIKIVETAKAKRRTGLLKEKQRRKSAEAAKKRARRARERKTEIERRRFYRAFLKRRKELADSAMEKLAYLERRGGESAKAAMALMRVIKLRKDSIKKGDSEEAVFNGYVYWRADIAYLNSALTRADSPGKLTFQEIRSLFSEI